MWVWVLVLHLSSSQSGITTIEEIKTEQQCEAALEEWKRHDPRAGGVCLKVEVRRG